MKKMLLLAVAAVAAHVLVASTLYVTPTGAGNKDGSSWANAFAGIQAAVDAADAAVATGAALAPRLARSARPTGAVRAPRLARSARPTGAALALQDH